MPSRTMLAHLSCERHNAANIYLRASVLGIQIALPTCNIPHEHLLNNSRPLCIITPRVEVLKTVAGQGALRRKTLKVMCKVTFA